ncbi:DNA glycosylase AlkZ-like family protein [Streptomyces sp. NPDC090022]|uniref:DNA glycosylase AlkZ-like family protein n=1 Tax=Streptomyces sp. NPDC090022 TaxID=3365920 RepID=UPI0038024B19
MSSRCLPAPIPPRHTVQDGDPGAVAPVAADGARTGGAIHGGPSARRQRRPAPGLSPAGVWLLPYFDAFTVASQPRELLFPGAAWDRALSKGQAGNFPVLLVDGTVAGVWHQKKSGSKVAITVEPLTDLTTPQLRRLDEQVERIAAIQHARPTLTIGPVGVGAHA